MSGGAFRADSAESRPDPSKRRLSSPFTPIFSGKTEATGADPDRLVRAWISPSPAWLDIRSAPQSEAADLEWLGAGEREAILLADKIRAD